MKYVKGISLFFVYPACCFLIGLTMGSIIFEHQDLDTTVEESGGQEESLSGQYVMNPNAIQEIQTVESVREEKGYFITIGDDGCVIVYHGDRQTIFLSTDINAKELPADVQADLKAWRYMENEGMLYDFLENYTS